ncbi:hypothetical protein KGM_205737 [Danaus plexippus plexippus]|uniref:Uncharacterized protein n=2 Tax=Danaus plexippus TaxID=13037 RepID=A0A212FD79_DANPL|nr:hypothetical protein KGM_205737 [Danaus plexippus plexippus]
MPLAGASRAGPAQCSPARRLDASSCDVSSLSSGEEDERLRRYRTNNQPQTVLVQPAGSQPKPQPSSPVAPPVQVQANPPAATSSHAKQSACPVIGKRPPPRTVSFAGAPDGELVLSPAQLR